MKYSHTFDPVALKEYHDSLSWYGLRSLNVAANFISAINERISNICSTPRLYRNSYRNLREVSLKKFPFSIVYFIDEATHTIVITSVYHHKKNPKRKYKKR